MFRSVCLSSAVMFLPLALLACGDESESPGGSDAAVDGGRMQTEGIAVVHSDYQTASVSFLDLQGNLRLDDCINSGSAPTNLTQALSGDIALPSSSAATGEVILIDRESAVLTLLNPASCGVNRQLDVSTGFAANPHDVAMLAADKAFITRYAPNASDVLVLNPTNNTIIANIKLTDWAVTSAEGTVLPRPDRILPFEGKLYVTLNNLSADFKVAGTGRVVIIDPTTYQVEGSLDVPALKNCASLQAVAPHEIAVACGGVFADGAMQVNYAGIARFNTQARSLISTNASSSFGGRAISAGSLTITSDQRLMVVTSGNFGAPPPDQLWMATFSEAAPTAISSAEDSFVFGGLFYNSLNQRVFLADGNANNPRVRIFDVSSPTPQELAPVASGPKRKLPPRDLARF